MPINRPYLVVGYIDNYGAIHYKKVKLGDEPKHEALFPGKTHKRWRFIVSDWHLDQSVLSGVKLNSEDGETVCALMRKILKPPEWFLEGEAWDDAGRPRGKAYDKFLREYKRKAKRKLTQKLADRFATSRSSTNPPNPPAAQS